MTVSPVEVPSMAAIACVKKLRLPPGRPRLLGAQRLEPALGRRHGVVERVELRAEGCGIRPGRLQPRRPVQEERVGLLGRVDHARLRRALGQEGRVARRQAVHRRVVHLDVLEAEVDRAQGVAVSLLAHRLQADSLHLGVHVEGSAPPHRHRPRRAVGQVEGEPALLHAVDPVDRHRADEPGLREDGGERASPAVHLQPSAGGLDPVVRVAVHEPNLPELVVVGCPLARAERSVPHVEHVGDPRRDREALVGGLAQVRADFLLEQADGRQWCRVLQLAVLKGLERGAEGGAGGHGTGGSAAGGKTPHGRACQGNSASALRQGDPDTPHRPWGISPLQMRKARYGSPP
jgi:hypothetical protein